MSSAQQQTMTLFQIGLGQFTDETYGRRISPSTLFTRFTISANITQTYQLKIPFHFYLSSAWVSFVLIHVSLLQFCFSLKTFYPSHYAILLVIIIILLLLQIYFFLLQNKFSLEKSEESAISE